jgi:hypothetical protein
MSAKAEIRTSQGFKSACELLACHIRHLLSPTRCSRQRSDTSAIGGEPDIEARPNTAARDRMCRANFRAQGERSEKADIAQTAPSELEL